MPRPEHHYSQRAGWLRAAVLGANDGILSIAGLLMGVAAATSDFAVLMQSGVAGALAGSFSMAAGEYVSVRTQSDIEETDLKIEQKALRDAPDEEKEELAEIYRRRGLDHDLAERVADQLMKHDALLTHARDELGISDQTRARPIQAAFSSATSFLLGAAIPMTAILLAPHSNLMTVIAFSTLLSLASLGAVSAKLSGASPFASVSRIVFWGVVTMATTSIIGTLIGANL